METTEAVDPEIAYTLDVEDVDWAALIANLEADNFHNGRTVEQMERSFRNSTVAVLARQGSAVVGTVRVLSDGVCNAYVVDVWTLARLRRRGIARRMLELALAQLPGQHVYLFTDHKPEFYAALGFEAQGIGMGRVVGRWLESGPPPADA